MLAFVFFDDTFRRERSAVYVGTLRRRRQEREKKERKLRELQEQQKNGSRVTVIGDDKQPAGNIPTEEKARTELSEDVGTPKHEPVSSASSTKDTVFVHADGAGGMPTTSPPVEAELKGIRLSLRDVNPIRPMINAFRRPNNVAILTASGAFSSESGSTMY